WIAADRLDESPLHLVVGNLDIGFLSDLRKHKAKAHPALRETLVFLTRLLFRRVLVFERAPGSLEVTRYLRPDIVELRLDQLGRSFELVALIQCIQQLALRLLARHLAILALELAADD